MANRSTFFTGKFRISLYVQRSTTVRAIDAWTTGGWNLEQNEDVVRIFTQSTKGQGNSLSRKRKNMFNAIQICMVIINCFFRTSNTVNNTNQTAGLKLVAPSSVSFTNLILHGHGNAVLDKYIYCQASRFTLGTCFIRVGTRL